MQYCFMEVCRAVGIAARFVSGYQEGDTEQQSRDLHAWVEVYLPGAGLARLRSDFGFGN